MSETKTLLADPRQQHKPPRAHPVHNGNLPCVPCAGRPPDEDGDLLVSIKVLVTNNSDKKQVVVLTIKGLDHENFEIFSLYLRSEVGANEARSLTDTHSVVPAAGLYTFRLAPVAVRIVEG